MNYFSSGPHSSIFSSSSSNMEKEIFSSKISIEETIKNLFLNYSQIKTSSGEVSLMNQSLLKEVIDNEGIVDISLLISQLIKIYNDKDNKGISLSKIPFSSVCTAQQKIKLNAFILSSSQTFTKKENGKTLTYVRVGEIQRILSSYFGENGWQAIITSFKRINNSETTILIHFSLSLITPSFLSETSSSSSFSLNDWKEHKETLLNQCFTNALVSASSSVIREISLLYK